MILTIVMNVLLSAYNTPHDTIPFNSIRVEDYKPALLKGIEEEDREIDWIVKNTDRPTFQNTIEALEKSGNLLDRTSNVFYNLLSAETCDEMDALAEEMSPLMTEHSNNIMLNRKLFDRVKAVYEEYKAKDFDGLNTEERRLLEDTYKDFVTSKSEAKRS